MFYWKNFIFWFLLTVNFPDLAHFTIVQRVYSDHLSRVHGFLWVLRFLPPYRTTKRQHPHLWEWAFCVIEVKINCILNFLYNSAFYTAHQFLFELQLNIQVCRHKHIKWDLQTGIGVFHMKFLWWVVVQAGLFVCFYRDPAWGGGCWWWGYIGPYGCFCYQSFQGSGPGVILMLCGFYYQTFNLFMQCRPRSEAAEHGVWSGSTLFAYRNFYKK